MVNDISDCGFVCCLVENGVLCIGKLRILAFFFLGILFVIGFVLVVLVAFLSVLFVLVFFTDCLIAVALFIRCIRFCFLMRCRFLPVTADGSGRAFLAVVIAGFRQGFQGVQIRRLIELLQHILIACDSGIQSRCIFGNADAHFNGRADCRFQLVP